jgi:hypothetical protein
VKNKRHWKPIKEYAFLACDGDATGSHVAKLVFQGKIKEAHKMSQIINVAGNAVVHHLEVEHGAEAIIQGGDDILVKIPSDRWQDSIVDHIRDLFHEYTGFTLSAGLGDTPQEAVKSLVIAKDTGKDRAVYWSPNKQSSYQSAVASKITELKMKIKAAGG